MLVDDLADLLVDRDRLEVEALGRVELADALVGRDGVGVLLHLEIEVADLEQRADVLGIVDDELLVLDDGLVVPLLLDKLLGSLKDLVAIDRHGDEDLLGLRWGRLRYRGPEPSSKHLPKPFSSHKHEAKAAAKVNSGATLHYTSYGGARFALVRDLEDGEEGGAERRHGEDDGEDTSGAPRPAQHPSAILRARAPMTWCSAMTASAKRSLPCIQWCCLQVVGWVQDEAGRARNERDDERRDRQTSVDVGCHLPSRLGLAHSCRRGSRRPRGWSRSRRGCPRRAAR